MQHRHSRRSSGAAQDGGLRQQLKILGETISRYDAELKDLREEFLASPPELDSLSEENAMLAHKARQTLDELNTMRAAHTALKREATESRQRVQGLQGERDALRLRLSDAERLEKSEHHVAELTARTLAAELRRREDYEKTLDSEIAFKTEYLIDKESRIKDSRCQVEKSQQEKATEMEVQLAVARQVAAHEQAGVSREVEEAQAEVAKLQHHTEALASELMESECQTKETERKALEIARELFDTSQAIARLRTEATEQNDLKSELEQAQREEGMLEQRIAETKRAAATGAFRPASAIATHGAVASELSVLVESELQDIRLHEDQAVNVALRSAWEMESSEHQQTVKKLVSMQAQMQPLCEWLAKLITVAAQWREDLIAITGFGQHLPKLNLPAESAWCDKAEFSHIVRILCEFVEVLVTESAKRLLTANVQAYGQQLDNRHAPVSDKATIPWVRSQSRRSAVSSLSGSSSR